MRNDCERMQYAVNARTSKRKKVIKKGGGGGAVGGGGAIESTSFTCRGLMGNAPSNYSTLPYSPFSTILNSKGIIKLPTCSFKMAEMFKCAVNYKAQALKCMHTHIHTLTHNTRTYKFSST